MFGSQFREHSDCSGYTENIGHAKRAGKSERVNFSTSIGFASSTDLEVRLRCQIMEKAGKSDFRRLANPGRGQFRFTLRSKG